MVSKRLTLVVVPSEEHPLGMLRVEVLTTIPENQNEIAFRNKNYICYDFSKEEEERVSYVTTNPDLMVAYLVQLLDGSIEDRNGKPVTRAELREAFSKSIKCDLKLLEKFQEELTLTSN